MQLSYAQRLEDYHLDLVFAGQATGFYVDIGAGHPVADNVSYWFYLKGWRGVVVEPQRALADMYRHVRPRDTALCTLVGRQDGEIDFHVVDRLHGLSSTSEEHARTALQFGAQYTTTRMPMRTLGAIAAECGISTFDFLKIDVEGAEGDVLAGADWRTFRPRVILAEALAPGNLGEAWRQWEPALLAQGYTYAFFDSLNRFYVANEAAELVHRFPAAPAPREVVQHLFDLGCAPDQPAHPDHALARRLVDGFLAVLPLLDRELLAELLLRKEPSEFDVATLGTLLLGTAEYPGAVADVSGPDGTDRLRALMESDRFRAALGRIASAYDGGQVRA